MKTLKREEIHANEYRDLDDLRTNIKAFIEQYYNRLRLHSALGYRPPEEFEQAASSATTSQGATMSFFRHPEIYRSDAAGLSGEPGEPSSPAHRFDESPTGYSSAGCSPAEPASASPTEDHFALWVLRSTILFQRTVTASFPACLTRGVHPIICVHLCSSVAHCLFSHG